MKKISANEKLIEVNKDAKVYDNKIRELQEKIRKEEKEFILSCEHKKNEYDYKIKNLTNKFNFLENEASKLREQFSKIQSEKVDFSSIKDGVPYLQTTIRRIRHRGKTIESRKNFNLDKAKRKKEK